MRIAVLAAAAFCLALPALAGTEDFVAGPRVPSFGKTAENAGQYLQKGRQVYVEGRLKADKYKDKEGVEKTSVEVVCNVLQFIGGKGEGCAEGAHGGCKGNGASGNQRRC